MRTQRFQLALRARQVNILKLQFFNAFQQRSLSLQLTDIVLRGIQGQLGRRELFIDLVNLLGQESQAVAVIEAGQPVFIQALLILLVEESFLPDISPWAVMA